MKVNKPFFNAYIKKQNLHECVTMNEEEEKKML